MKQCSQLSLHSKKHVGIKLSLNISYLYLLLSITSLTSSGTSSPTGIAPGSLSIWYVHISVPHGNCFMVLFSNKSMLKIIITDIYKQNPHNSVHNNNFFEQNSQNNMHKNNFHKRNHETTCTTLSIKRDIDTTKHTMKAHASTSQVTQLLISRLRKRKEWDDIVALFQLLNKDQRRGQPARHIRRGADRLPHLLANGPYLSQCLHQGVSDSSNVQRVWQSRPIISPSLYTNLVFQIY